MAYPTIFVNGSCDITDNKLCNVKLEEFIDHIYHNVDNRVTKHPTLRFLLLNLSLRNRALQQGSFVVAQQLNESHLSIPELRANLESEDASVPRKLINIAGKFVNSDPLWRERKQELDALAYFRKKDIYQCISTQIVVQSFIGNL